PEGYLFVCPSTHFRTGRTSLRWPECPAFWSLDPTGVERLSTDEATNLGFPPIRFTTEVWGRSWDGGVYSGLHKFHWAKGFDPESQDVAEYLGYPLYQVTG
ncbi:hypothetical protein DFH07DRAFT_703875, partial [Mycena maculata]